MGKGVSPRRLRPSYNAAMSRRVVITGIGVVTGFGCGMDPLWSALNEGASCLRRIRAFDPTGFHCTLGGEVTDFNVKDHVPKSYRKAVKVMARDIELAVGAAASAVDDAALATKASAPDDEPSYPVERVGCNIGAGLIAADVSELTAALSTATDANGDFSYEQWGEAGMGNLTPLWLLKYLPNMLACHVTILHACKGPSNTITCAEASGGLSIGESMRVIQRDHADLCLAGGAESKVNPMGMLRWEYANRLAHVPESDASTPGWTSVRPYDPDAPGTVLGEGGGILTVEALETAQARGARMYAELTGFGAGQSPASMDPEESSEGLRIAIEAALRDAETDPADIDAIVPHAAGAPALDAEEVYAMRRVFGDRLPNIPLVTLPPHIGELVAGGMGAAAAVAARCMGEQRLPARLHAGSPIDDADASPAEARPAELRNILVCSNALGGQNAALILRRREG